MVYAENEGEVFLGRSVTKTTTMSEETMRKVDSVIRRIIDEQYTIARKLIEDNKDKMHAMAQALLEWETIDSDQIDDIMAASRRARRRTGRLQPARQVATRLRWVPTAHRPRPECIRVLGERKAGLRPRFLFSERRSRRLYKSAQPGIAHRRARPQCR
jgi:hypothetical protein